MTTPPVIRFEHGGYLAIYDMNSEEGEVVGYANIRDVLSVMAYEELQDSVVPLAERFDGYLKYEARCGKEAAFILHLERYNELYRIPIAAIIEMLVEAMTPKTHRPVNFTGIGK